MWIIQEKFRRGKIDDAWSYGSLFTTTSNYKGNTIVRSPWNLNSDVEQNGSSLSMLYTYMENQTSTILVALWLSQYKQRIKISWLEMPWGVIEIKIWWFFFATVCFFAELIRGLLIYPKRLKPLSIIYFYVPNSQYDPPSVQWEVLENNKHLGIAFVITTRVFPF